MNTIYRLDHYHNNYGYDQTLYIGIFSTCENAEKAIDQLIQQPGFRDYSKEAFKITEIMVNQVKWSNETCYVNDLP